MSKKKIMFAIFLFIIVVTIGFVEVNVSNTKALSPIGNTEDNYEMVSEEFGEDFEEFIKDSSPIKIYTQDGNVEDTTIRILDKELRIREENPFVKAIFNISSNVAEVFRDVKDKVYKKIDGINNKKEINNIPKENNNEDEKNEGENNISNDKNNNLNKDSNNTKNENQEDYNNTKKNNNRQNTELDKIVDEFLKERENNEE